MLLSPLIVSVSAHLDIWAVGPLASEFLVVSAIFSSVDPGVFSPPSSPLTLLAVLQEYWDREVLSSRLDRLLEPLVSHHQNRHYTWNFNTVK